MISLLGWDVKTVILFSIAAFGVLTVFNASIYPHQLSPSMDIQFIPSIIDIILNEVWMAFQNHANKYYRTTTMSIGRDMHSHHSNWQQMHVPSKWKPFVVTIHNSGAPLLLISASPKRFLAIGANKIQISEIRQRSCNRIPFLLHRAFRRITLIINQQMQLHKISH